MFGRRGQASVEAAALLPMLMLLFALLVQPACVLYTRTVMLHAAGEAVRVRATSSGDGIARDFALRRLEAVPEASLFHVGGRADWRVSFEQSPHGGTVTARITGHLRPLPFFGVATRLMGRHDENGLLLEASVTRRVRARWVGGDYESWMSMWG